MKELFRHAANKISYIVGTPWAFIFAISAVIVWAVCGPIFQFSDTWQLVINTSTTIVTFLMVFLIQNTQNRDSKAIHIKLDELIRTTRGARNKLVDAEELSDDDLEALETQFRELQSHYLGVIESRKKKKRRNAKLS
jgi:low affinity Fe/Cu permease